MREEEEGLQEVRKLGGEGRRILRKVRTFIAGGRNIVA